MYLWMYVCMYVCMCICTSRCVRICVCTYECTYVCTYECTYVCTYVRTYVHTHTYIYTYIHTYVRMCVLIIRTKSRHITAFGKAHGIHCICQKNTVSLTFVILWFSKSVPTHDILDILWETAHHKTTRASFEQPSIALQRTGDAGHVDQGGHGSIQ